MSPFVPSSHKRLQTISDVVFGEISRFFTPNACVLATRVAIDVLKNLKIQAYPLQVEADIKDARAAAHYAHHPDCDTECLRHNGNITLLGFGDAPKPPATGPVAATSESDVSVTVQMPDGPDDSLRAFFAWAGHLAVVAERRYLMDLTISQASRPGMEIAGTLVVPVNEAWQRRRSTLTLGLDNDLTITYNVARSQARDEWRRSPDWATDTRMHEQLVDNSLRTLRGKPVEYDPDLMVIRALVGRL